MIRGRLTRASRAKALEAGMYQSANQTFIRLADLTDDHLINALLKSLQHGDGPEFTGPLTQEVERRGLQAAALQAASVRQDTWMRRVAASTVVTRRNGSESSFSRAGATVYAGLLTVRSIDEGTILRTFEPGDWRKAKVYMATGDLLATYEGGQ